MKHTLLLLILFLFLFGSVAVAQKSGKRARKKTVPATQTVISHSATDTNKRTSTKVLPVNTLEVYLQDGRAYLSIPVDSQNGKTIIRPQAYTDNIVLLFPGQEFMKYSIQFNSDNPLRLAFNCEDTNCHPINLTDIDKGQLLIRILDNHIIQVGNQPVNYPIDGKSPYIAIIKADDTKKLLTGSEIKRSILDKLDIARNSQGIDMHRVIPPSDNPIHENIFYCGTVTCPACDNIECPCDLNTIRKLAKRAGDVPYRFDELFQKPVDNTTAPITRLISPGNIFYKSPNRDYNSHNAVTPRYKIIYDARDVIPDKQSKVTFLKLKRRRGFEYYKVKKSIFPNAYQEVQVEILCYKDSNYIVATDEKNYFLDGAGDFQHALTHDNAGSAKIDTDDSSGKNVPTSSAAPKSSATTTVSTPAGKIRIDSLAQSGIHPSDIDTFKPAQYVKIIDKNATDKDSVRILNEVAKHINAINDTVKAGLITDSIYRAQKGFIYDSNAAPGLKDTLMALEVALQLFNQEYLSIDFQEQDYAEALTCLKVRIKKALKIPVTNNSDQLTRSLVYMVLDNKRIDTAYCWEFKAIIKAIGEEYATALNKKATMKILAKQLPVPNSDLFEVKIQEDDKLRSEIFKREFKVSRGFKIDFSTGLFFNGISRPDFELQPARLQFNDPVRGIVDTSGSFIYRNEHKLNYGTGFLMHAYTRTGAFINVGLATGIMLEPDSRFCALLGASLMLNVRDVRIALSGGMAIGQNKELTSYENRFLVPKDTIYTAAATLPQSFSGTTLELTSSWTRSYFLGLTFNFATISPGSASK